MAENSNTLVLEVSSGNIITEEQFNQMGEEPAIEEAFKDPKVTPTFFVNTANAFQIINGDKLAYYKETHLVWETRIPLVSKDTRYLKLSEPVYNNNKLYLAAGRPENRIMVFDANTGTFLKDIKNNLGNAPKLATVTDQIMAVYGFQSLKVYNGSNDKWYDLAIPKNIKLYTWAIDEKAIYLLLNNGLVRCFDLATGNLLWDNQLPITPRNVHTPGSVSECYYTHVKTSDTALFFVLLDNSRSQFIVLDRKTGKELWRSEKSQASEYAFKHNRVFYLDFKEPMCLTAYDMLKPGLAWATKLKGEQTEIRQLFLHNRGIFAWGYIWDKHEHICFFFDYNGKLVWTRRQPDTYFATFEEAGIPYRTVSQLKGAVLKNDAAFFTFEAFTDRSDFYK